MCEEKYEKFVPKRQGDVEMFIACVCSECKLDGFNDDAGNSCPIVMEAIMADRGVAPKQWIRNEVGDIGCTMFERLDGLDDKQPG